MNKLAYITYNRIEEFLEKTASTLAEDAYAAAPGIVGAGLLGGGIYGAKNALNNIAEVRPVVTKTLRGAGTLAAIPVGAGLVGKTLYDAFKGEKTAASKTQEWLEAGIAQTHRGKGTGPMSEEYASYLNDKPSFYFGRTSKNSIDRISMDKKTGKLSYTPMTRKEYNTFKKQHAPK